MGILSEFYKNYPIQNEYIVPIDFNSIEQIPESYAWVQSNNKDQSQDFSTIDIEDPNASELVFHACQKWGLFRISNHGISRKLLEEVEFETRKLFSLPLEQKMKVLRSPRGATGYGSLRISPFFSKLMWYEGFTIMENSMVDHAKELWPNEYEKFCNVMNDYQTRMKELAEKLKVLIFTSLRIPQSDPTWEIGDGIHSQGPKNNLCTALQLNWYPASPDPSRTMGLAPHTDTFLFTILHQSRDTSGLQLFKDGVGWIQVDPKPGTLMVNVGDLLHIISNGRFPSVVHKAIVNNASQRISVAYFFGPPLEFQVSPFLGYEGCKGPCFESLRVKEYVSIKSKHPDLALSHVRIG